MNTNLAYNYSNEYWEETLNGKIVMMSPRAAVNHNRVANNIFRIFSNYLNGKKCKAFDDGTDVHLTEKDTVIPDAFIVCNKDYIKSDGIYGPPSLIVEVLSPTTANHDKGYKKELYEKCGVCEYWIVDTNSKSIDVFLLENGKYKLDYVYQIYPDYVLAKLDDEKKSLIKYDIKTSLFDDLIINIEEVFSALIIFE